MVSNRFFINNKIFYCGGPHLEHGVYPLFIAFSKVDSILLLDKYPHQSEWYFFPVLIMYTTTLISSFTIWDSSSTSDSIILLFSLTLLFSIDSSNCFFSSASIFAFSSASFLAWSSFTFWAFCSASFFCCSSCLALSSAIFLPLLSHLLSFLLIVFQLLRHNFYY